jgi:hypothetical protein
MLPEVVAAVGDRVDVLMDGGIRRGADIVKARCLGARAVLIGRAYGWALGAAGGARRCPRDCDSQGRLAQDDAAARVCIDGGAGRLVSRLRLEQLPTSNAQFPTTPNGQRPNELGIGSWAWLGIGIWESGIE